MSKARDDLARWLEETTWVEHAIPERIDVQVTDQPAPMPEPCAMRWAPGLPEEDDEQEPFYGPERGAMRGLSPSAMLLDEMAPACRQMAEALVRAWEQLKPLVEALAAIVPSDPAALTQRAQPTTRPARGSLPHRLDGRVCPGHGEPLRAGQCRRCQRQQVRAAAIRR